RGKPVSPPISGSRALYLYLSGRTGRAAGRAGGTSGRTMSFFAYHDGQLHAEQVPLARIAERVGTPFYCYSSSALTAAYRDFAAAFADQPATICYALKANSNLAVVATLAALGAGADVVSEGELRRALRAGVPPQKIVFAGVGKTAE